jgi:hypothetical protein
LWHKQILWFAAALGERGSPLQCPVMLRDCARNDEKGVA